MWIFGRGPQASPPSYVSRSSQFIDRSFQWRYARIVIFTVLAAVAVVGGPLVYYANQNYFMFREIAYKLAPAVVGHLEQEIVVLNLWFAGASALVAVFSVGWAIKATGRLIGPIKVVQNHIHEMIRGKFQNTAVRIRDNDEFHDFVDDYNYFLKVFNRNQKRELDLLKKVRQQNTNFTSSIWLDEMIEDKQRQLDVPRCPAIDYAEGAAESPVSRHVS